MRQLDSRTVKTLADRLASKRVEGRPEGWLPLSEMMKGVGGREKPWGSAFTMMLESKTIPFALLDETDLPDVAAAQILVPPTAGKALRAAEFLKSDYPRCSFDEHLTVRDTAALLNVPDNKFTTIRREHFAKAVAADGRIAVGTVVEAARRWVSPGELGAPTGRTPHDCFTELARTPLPRSLLGWPRALAEELVKLTAGARLRIAYRTAGRYGGVVGISLAGMRSVMNSVSGSCPMCRLSPVE